MLTNSLLIESKLFVLFVESLSIMLRIQVFNDCSLRYDSVRLIPKYLHVFILHNAGGRA